MKTGGTSDLHLRINNAGLLRCEPNWSWYPQAGSFADYDLWYVWAGRGWLATASDKFDVHPGCCFCLRPGQAYAATHDPAHRLGVCFIHFDFLNARGKVVHPPPVDLPPLFSRMGDIEFHEHVLRRIVQLTDRAKQPRDSADAAPRLAAQEAENYLRAILTAAEMHHALRAEFTPHRQQKEEMDTIARRIREKPGELFSVEALAADAGYTPDHFARLFTRHIGLSPKEFCIRARMERAQQLLRESGLTLQQIAYGLGYADVFFFSRQFKQRIGLPPAQWRDAVTHGTDPGNSPASLKKSAMRAGAPPLLNLPAFAAAEKARRK